jgi:hypothetical protein
MSQDLWRVFFLPRQVTEATKFQVITNRREEAPRLAAKTEKRATKSAKIQILLFLESEAANQNQKFPFHFLSAPPTPPAENQKKGRKIFGFVPRPKGADEARNPSVRFSPEFPRAPRV